MITDESNIIFTGTEADKKYHSIATYHGQTVKIKVVNRTNGQFAEGKTTTSIFKLHAKLVEALDKL